MTSGTGARPLLGAIEGGGTKFLCAVGYGPTEIVAQTRIDTGSPEQTLRRVIEFFRGGGWSNLERIGVGTFGTLELSTHAGEAFGSTLKTTKPGWDNVPIVRILRNAFPSASVGIDTDVNAAALAEFRWGAARGCDPTIYVTVGTGIGVGVVVNGKPLHGLMHPELGHITCSLDALPSGVDDFKGVCSVHGRCVEGMASGTALRARTGTSAGTLPVDHPVWNLEAAHLGYLLSVCVLAFSPERIVLGGGVGILPGLIERVRSSMLGLVAGYIPRARMGGDASTYVVPPYFTENAGLVGAFALA